MLGQFFGDGLGEFGTEMPEERVPPGAEQAHEAVANQNEAGEFEKSFGDEFLIHKIVRGDATLTDTSDRREPKARNMESGCTVFA